MVIQKFIYIRYIIYHLVILLISAESQILDNPYLVDFSPNYAIYNKDNDIIIHSDEKKYTQNAITREISSTEFICPITEVNTIIQNPDLNKNYIYSLSSQYLISITDSDSNCDLTNINDLNINFLSSNNFIGSIYEGEFIPENFYQLSGSQSKKNLRCKQLNNEIILYGKIEEDAGFYFMKKNLMVNLGIYCSIEDIFYCNKIDNSIYMCVYLCNNQIMTHFFTYITREANSGGECVMETADYKTISENRFRHLMVQKIDSGNKLLICAIKDEDEKVECFLESYTYEEYENKLGGDENGDEGGDIGGNGEGGEGGENGEGGEEGGEGSGEGGEGGDGNGEGGNNGDGNGEGGNEPKIEEIEIIHNLTFEYSQSAILSFQLESTNNDYCQLKNVLSNEYLLCCGGTDIIKCFRISQEFSSLNSFILSIEGSNTNLKLISSSRYIYLIYKNTLNSFTNIYEYTIYTPECPNKEYSIIPLGSISDYINNLYIKKLYTNYYLKFISFPSYYISLILNDEIIYENNLTSLNPELINDNSMFELRSINEENINEIIINYEIILEQTFSSKCNIKINILECYKSCKVCSKSKMESDINNHNCIEGKCNENYYQAADIPTNCFDIYEAQSNWYLNYEEKKFDYCNEECPTCNGPTNHDCLSCKANSELNYLYNKVCYTECPDGYYPEEKSGYYLCKECYSTCATCSGKGDQSTMKCETCKPNSIDFGSNCFQIYNSTLKTFILPWDNSISNCQEKYGIYIKDDSFTCIYSKPDGYYISNIENGIISRCHADCLTCEEKYTETNTKCLICQNPDMNFFQGNCITNCYEGYYSKPKSASNIQKTCERCFYTCKKCPIGQEYGSGNKLTNMNCDECLKDSDGNEIYIKINKNCFSINIYEENKINFDISLINSNPANKIKTCLDYNLSIIYGEYECKTKPLNSYYVIKNEQNTGIIKYCHEACATCNEGEDITTGNRNCLTCSNGYYKTEDSNTNCVLESSIPDNYYKYIEDNIFYKCYNLCNKCVRILEYKTDINKMGCESCINNYYIQEDTTNCYDITFLDSNPNYYLSLEENKFKKCYFSCKKCSQGFNPELNLHNCDECKDNYYFEEGKNNCYNDTILNEGYYFDNFKYKKCYTNCKTCTGYLIEENMNCILCAEGFYKINGTNNCINDITNKGYYGINGIAYPCENNCLTCSNGMNYINENNINNDNEIITNISYNCLSCDQNNKNLFLVENINNCEPETFKNKGYYLSSFEDTDTKIFKKCYKSCSLCNKYLEGENHNCEKCAKGYYPFLDDPYEKNCYDDIMKSRGYRLVRGYWQTCYESCDTCFSAPTFDSSGKILLFHNCLSCYEGYNFIYNTKDCVNDTYLNYGYYLDDNDLFYKKCDISCKTCNKYSNAENPRCKSCNNDEGYYFAENQPNDICYNQSMIDKLEVDKEYILSERKDEEGNLYRIWGFCHETCVTCFKFGNDIEHGCSTCIPKHYLIYNTTNCVKDDYATNNGYYFNKTFLKYVKCDDSCINCYGAPKEETTNCKKCNNKDGYYNVEGKTNTLCRSESTIEEGYFLNKFNEPYKWNECYENCARCEYKGIASKMKCLSCRTNLKNKFNKYKYFILLEGNCIESCENNLFLTSEGECVKECPNNTYQFIFEYNYTCVNKCPNKYIISEDKKKCILAEFPENITMKDFKDIILKKIENYINSSRIINFDNFKARIISSDELNLTIFQSKDIFSINDLENILSEIKKENNMENNDFIIITQIEYESNMEISQNLKINKNEIDLGKNIEILLYDTYGNKLIIPNTITDSFYIKKYIGNLLYIDFNEAKWFYDKNIDLFNPSDPFFNDICYPFKSKSNSDVVLKDRRNYFFKNVNFCGDYCLYDKINYDLMIVNCLCNISILNTEKNDENKKNILNDNKFKEELYDTNLLLSKCINLVFDSNIIKNNAGFISNIILISFEIIFSIIFIKNGLNPLKNFLLIFEPNLIASPPKLETLMTLAEPQKHIKDEVKKSKLINHLLNAKKRKRPDEKNEIDDALVVDYQNEDNEDNLYKKYKYNENNKSELESDSESKNEEKKTGLKRKKFRVRNIKVKKYGEKYEEKKEKHVLDYDLEKNIDHESLKKHMKLGNIHTSNYNYLAKSTENVDLNSGGEKNSEEKKTGKKKKKIQKKNIKIIKNEKKNNYLYSRIENLFIIYEEAIKNETKFSEIYLLFLIENNFILQTIISDSFINLFSIKINYLCFRLILIFALNALFYTDNNITQIFENKGKLNFINSLPKSIYSILITILFCIILKYLLNNKKEIYKLINNKDKKGYNILMSKILKTIKIKLIIYFSIQFSFSLFFLYYSSAFCAVYQNSQIFWFYGFLESILFDIIFSCVFCFLVALCRFIGVKKRIKCLYQIAQIINYI